MSRTPPESDAATPDMGDSSPVQTVDEIHLELPTAPAFGRVMRIAASHLALRSAFSAAEVDDLRLAMDEVAVMLLGPGAGDGRLDVVYSIGDRAITVDARVVPAAVPEIDSTDAARCLPDDAVARFEALVGELVDSYAVDRSRRSVTLTKARLAT